MEYITEKNNVELVIEYEFDKGEKGRHTLDNGDAGYPPTPPSVEITSIKIPDQTDHELIDLMNPKVILELEEEILNDLID